MTRAPVISPPAEWEAYEALPEAVRDVMKAAKDPFDSASVLAQLRQFEAAGGTAEQYAAWLKFAAR